MGCRGVTRPLRTYWVSREAVVITTVCNVCNVSLLKYGSTVFLAGLWQQGTDSKRREKLTVMVVLNYGRPRDVLEKETSCAVHAVLAKTRRREEGLIMAGTPSFPGTTSRKAKVRDVMSRHRTLLYLNTGIFLRNIPRTS